MNTINNLREKVLYAKRGNALTLFYKSMSVLLVMLSIGTHTKAQDSYCFTMGSPCVYNQNETVKFIPDQYSPELTINLNFHFYHQDGGDGNGDIFNPMNFAATWDGITVGQMADGNLDGINESVNAFTFADAIVWRMNNRLENNPQMNLPIGNTTPNLPYDFKFRVNHVEFHVWNPSQSVGTFPASSGDGINIYFFDNDEDVVLGPISFDLECGNVTVPDFPIGWDFTDDGIENPGSYGQHGYSSYGVDWVVIRESWVLFSHYADDWCDYQSAYGNHIWSCSRQILHEVGHAFCLPHTVLYGGGSICYNCEDYCDDTPTGQEMFDANGVHPGVCGVACAEDPSICTNNLMDYCEASVALTPKQLGRWYYSLYVDHLHTVYNDYCAHDGSTTTIFGGATPTWEGIRICKGDITVEAGATLTLKGRLWMPEHGKIIVKPGGKFYINGGCIGTLCPGLWEGIEVWGNNLLSQNTTNQGLVQLTNNALIEEARTGIRTIKNTGPTHYSNLDWSKTGGIIRATNSNFKNNLKAIEFMSYHNKNSQNVQINNVSYFYNCLFETNEISHFEGQSTTVGITMWDVIGIRIYGSTFDYLVPVETVDERGNGIVAAMSTFRIRDLGTDRNLFQNLNRAVNASGPMKGFFPYIDHAQFINNRGGVLFTGFASSKITRSDFNWLEVTNPGNIPTYGLYLQECQGYTIEENHFDAAGGIETFGVAINNSGDHITQIYKNYFTNLHAASMVYNDNRKEEVGADTGLQWLCNEYGTSNGNNSNSYHIGLWGEEVFGIPSSQGFYQGTNPSISAGNKFFEDCTPDPEDENEYPNERELKLMEQMDGSYYDYVHDAPIVFRPDCRTPGIGLVYTGVNLSNACPSHIGGVGQTPGGIVVGIQSAHTIEQQLKATYDGYANNGTGPQLKSIIQDASKTSIEVRNALMDAAPKVTDDILLLTLKRQPALQGWHMAQAMLANSPLRAGVMTELAKTDYYPFYKALVQAGQTGGLSTRQIMEMDYAHYLTAQHRDLDELLQLQFDLEEEEENWTVVEQQLLSLDYLLSDKDKALMEVAKGDFIAAQNALGTCKTEEADYCDVISSTLETQTNGMSSEGLPTNVAADLQAVSAIPDHKMKGTAQQLLAFWNVGTFSELLELPEGPGLRAARIPALEEVEIKMLGVNPNPANGTIYINYLLPDGWEEASITLYDNTGKIVAQFNASQFNGIIEMNGNALPAGLYTVELIADKMKIGTTKLTVIH